MTKHPTHTATHAHFPRGGRMLKRFGRWPGASFSALVGATLQAYSRHAVQPQYRLTPVFDKAGQLATVYASAAGDGAVTLRGPKPGAGPVSLSADAAGLVATMTMLRNLLQMPPEQLRRQYRALRAVARAHPQAAEILAAMGDPRI